MVFYWDIVPLILGCLVNLGLGAYALARSNEPATRTFGVMCFSLAAWCFCYSASFMSVSVEAKLVWTTFKYVGAALSPALWFVLSLQLTRRGYWLTTPVRLLLAAWVIFLLIIVATNAWHLEFWRKFYIEPGIIESRVEHGVLFSLYTIPSQLLMIASAFLYIGFYRRTADRFHLRAILFVVAAFVPLIANGFQLAGYKLMPQVDQVPLSLLISSLLFAVAILRYRALEILPIARDLVIRNIAAAVIVVNKNKRILELNPFAFGLSKLDSPLDQPLDQAFPEFKDIDFAPDDEHEISIETGVGKRCLIFRASEVREAETMGVVLVGLDITDRKLAEQELERRATTDPLTGVHNRRAFFELAESELSRARRAGDTLAVLMIDIDHFKSINDTKGHQAGDDVLVVVAERAQKALRDIDLIARYGGEEFIGLLSGEVEGVLQIAERLRKAYDGVPCPSTAGEISITISIGVAVIEDLSAPLQVTIEKADQALYESKTGGRNRITFYEEEAIS